jgi:hypothetical protein
VTQVLPASSRGFADRILRERERDGQRKVRNREMERDRRRDIEIEGRWEQDRGINGGMQRQTDGGRDRVSQTHR